MKQKSLNGTLKLSDYKCKRGDKVKQERRNGDTKQGNMDRIRASKGKRGDSRGGKLFNLS